MNETERCIAFCTYAIESDEVMVVENANLDPRFENNPLVKVTKMIAFYAGAPLVLTNGARVGTICIIDSEPRTFCREEIEGLELIARQVVVLLESRLNSQNARELVDLNNEILKATRARELSENRYTSLVNSATDAIVGTDSFGKILSWNGGACKIFGFSLEDVVGKPVTMIIPERFREAHSQGMTRMLSTKKSILACKVIELVGLRKNKTEIPIEMALSYWVNGEEFCFTSIIRDISDRKINEEELRSAKDFLEERILERHQRERASF